MGSLRIHDLVEFSHGKKKDWVPKWLYHYTNPAAASQILVSGVFKCRSFTRQRDPLEKNLFRHLSISLSSTTDSGMKREAARAQKAFTEAQKTRILSFAISNPFRKHFVGKHIDEYDANKYRLGYNLLAMWNHYGISRSGSHGGVCLIIDYAAFMEQCKKVFSKREQSWWKSPIHYTDKVVCRGDIIGISRKTYLSNRFIKPLLFAKAENYAYEQEYRIVYVGDTSDDSVDGTIPFGNSIRGLILGDEFNKHGDDEKTLKFIIDTKYKDLDVFEMQYIAPRDPIENVQDSKNSLIHLGLIEDDKSAW